MITKETRRESYERIKPKCETRGDVVLQYLGDDEKSARELAEELFRDGAIPFPERNFVAPRLNELVKKGKVEVVGKSKCEYTGRTVAKYARVAV